MCRIAGIVSSSASEERLPLVRRMLDSMARGGPDDEGTWEHQRTTLGHRRLSIIDLSAAGHQPMVLHSGLTISYNGEIYNYLTIRSELEKNGVKFFTGTDTEVIVEAYRFWGVKAFARFVGMFAFAIHDQSNNQVVLCRDSAGIKPLYYCIKNNQLIFASQVKAFRALDPAWAADKRWQTIFMAFGYLPHPYTTLADVQPLGRGRYAVVDLSTLQVREESFADEIRYQPSQQEPVDAVRDLMWNAVRRHLIADVPIGVFLSGGIDSSLLTLMTHHEVGDNLRTVSINFNDATFDERRYQEVIIQKTRHTNHKSYVVDDTLFWESLPDIWRAMDQPSIDGVNSYFVSREAHKSGLKAVLSGLGADELFGGYASFRRMKWINLLRLTHSNRLLAAVAGGYKDAYKRLAFLDIPGSVGDYLFLRGIHVPVDIARATGHSVKDVLAVLRNIPSIPMGTDYIQYVSRIEQEYYMTSQLLKDTDCMSMHFGLEARVPFLDQELTHVVESYPASIRFKTDRPKSLLTSGFSDVLPDEIVFRRKQGFTFPFAVWLKRGVESGRSLDSVWGRDATQRNNFVAGKSHWSKYWSGVVMQKF